MHELRSGVELHSGRRFVALFRHGRDDGSVRTRGSEGPAGGRSDRVAGDGGCCRGRAEGQWRRGPRRGEPQRWLHGAPHRLARAPADALFFSHRGWVSLSRPSQLDINMLLQPVFVTDAQGRLQRFNKAFSEVRPRTLRRPRDDLRTLSSHGRTLRRMISYEAYCDVRHL